VLHAKVTLLHFEHAVRLIVGSANLTKQGYRENREAVAVLTATQKRGTPHR
jgi:phosphatidylserine/phosphatidylglycerophosphate/cardiolipin synthase-like enzyme